MDFKFYSNIVNNIFRYSTKNGANMSFSAWHSRAREAYKELTELKAGLDADLAGKREDYSEKRVMEYEADYRAHFSEVAKNAKAKIAADLDAVIASKRAALSDAMTAPDAATSRTLDMMAKRDHVSVSDVSLIVPKCNGSLLGLQYLSDIAKKSGISFPRLPDAEELEQDIEKIQEFAAKMIDSIDTPRAAQSYYEIIFWTTDFPGLIKEQFDRLDDASFLQVDARQVGKKEPQITEAHVKTTFSTEQGTKQQVYTKLTLDGSEDMSVIARQFDCSVEDIERLNGGAALRPTHSGQTILVPGTLAHPEAGTGHVSETSHHMETVPASVAE